MDGRFIAYIKQNKCHFFNNTAMSGFGFNIIGDPVITDKSDDTIDFDNYSLIYPNLMCKNRRPKEFKLEGWDNFNRDCFDKITYKNGSIFFSIQQAMLFIQLCVCSTG